MLGPVFEGGHTFGTLTLTLPALSFFKSLFDFWGAASRIFCNLRSWRLEIWDSMSSREVSVGEPLAAVGADVTAEECDLHGDAVEV
jgi:hypothetical protein